MSIERVIVCVTLNRAVERHLGHAQSPTNYVIRAKNGSIAKRSASQKHMTRR